MNKPTALAEDEPNTPGPWGMEEVLLDSQHGELWIGPMRDDRLGKVAKIVCKIEFTPETKLLAQANARRIIECVNLF